MTSNQHHSQTRPRRRIVGILILLFALSVGLIAMLPAGTPVAMAARLFQSPVESPSPAPTVTPEQPTPQPEQPTPEPPTQTPSQPDPTQTPPPTAVPATFTPEPAPTAQPQSTDAPAEQSPADAERLPEGIDEPDDGKVDWVRLIDTTVLVFSWFWLACGVVVVIAVAVLLIVIYRRSKQPLL